MFDSQLQDIQPDQAELDQWLLELYEFEDEYAVLEEFEWVNDI